MLLWITGGFGASLNGVLEVFRSFRVNFPILQESLHFLRTFQLIQPEFLEGFLDRLEILVDGGVEVGGI